MNKPNIIFLTIDTLRLDALGRSPALMPNLDALAAKSMTFTQAITGGSWTQAAFPVIMTSTYASMYGGCLGSLAPERPSPIETLAANGYTAGGFSTSPLLSHAYGYNRGFHHFDDLSPNEKDPPLRSKKGGQRLLRNPLTHTILGWFGQQARPAKVYVTAEKLTDAACQWMDGVETPFFAWLHYMDVHWPYHQEDNLTRPADIAQAWRDLAHLHDVNWNGAPISDEERKHYIQLYEEAVRYTDDQLGRLLRYLEENGRMENSVIVILADHGEEFMEHGRWGHWESNLHDEVLKVPLIIHLPNQKTPQRIERQTRTLDLMPTLLDLCGCPISGDLMGASMKPLWAGDEAADARAYDASVSVSEMWRGHWHRIAVRTEAFKYIWDSKNPDEATLFDLQADPHESRNIADQRPDVVADLHDYVAERLRQMEATKPTNEAADMMLDEEIIGRLRDLGYVE